MIPNTKDRELASSGVAATGTFGISLPDAAHLMTILRSTLYSDKVLAVLREYSANAWDAHREAGKADLPIHVTIPTSMSPNLIIRDWGLGLSPDDVFHVYTQYGASTKRKSNTSVGMLGIGSKSGFAYSDSFTVTSWHDGKKRIYGAVLDPSRIGIINLLHEEDCPIEETGIEIQVAAKPSDVLEFTNKAVKLFKYFDPRPTINIDMPPLSLEATKLQHGTLIKGPDAGWTAVMGCVPYKIDVTQLDAVNNDGTGVADYVNKVSGVLNFDIGAVHVAASREGLEYSETTKKALIEKFGLVVDEYVQNTLDNIASTSISFWEKRLRSQVLNALKLPIPKKYKHILQATVKLEKKPKKSTITCHGRDVESISVDDDSRFILKDDARDLSGYSLSYNDYLVTKKNEKTDWADIEADLVEALKKNEIDGIPIVRLSTLQWFQPHVPGRRNSNKVKNPKHHAKLFKLNSTDRYSTRSRNWEIVTRTPHQRDVFVIISRFESEGCDIYSLYDEDRVLAKLFGVTMPEVYAYKNTEKKPVKSEDCVGTHYLEWRKTFIKSLFTKRIERLYNHWEWAQAADDARNRSPGKAELETVRAKLGVNHKLTELFKKQQAGERVVDKFKPGMEDAMEKFRSRLFNEDAKPAYEIHLDAVLKKYPLLEIYELEVLWGPHADKWFKYIKLVDKI